MLKREDVFFFAVLPQLLNINLGNITYSVMIEASVNSVNFMLPTFAKFSPLTLYRMEF